MSRASSIFAVTKAPNEVIHNRTTVRFDWGDRLRVLFGCAVHVDVDVELSVPQVTVVRTEGHAWVEKLLPSQRGGYAVESPKVDSLGTSGAVAVERLDKEVERQKEPFPGTGSPGTGR